MNALDHLVYAVFDLADGIDRLEQATGVRAAEGGRHPGWGTHNALLGLGDGRYLEIIARDPNQPNPPAARSFGLDVLAAPRLATWAARSVDLERTVELAHSAGIELGEIRPGHRARADGTVLSWRLTDPGAAQFDGLVPFFIDWGTSPHPSASAPAGAKLIDLRAEHPRPHEVKRVLDALDLDIEVVAGPAAMLVTTLDTPRGRIELR